MTRYCLPALLLAALPGFVRAQANATVPDPDPELERKSFIVAPGFEVNLYAADPLLAKPIQMNFDPQGRLWVACSETYPQIKPGQKANDKIVVLEDTKGAGKADKVTVFADGLLIPTGVEPGDGGAYVANSTELVHLSASKPGGKADRKRVLLSGFGTEDTHHIIHTFRWGPDCALYFNQSVYIHSHLETPFGVKRLNGGGIWRFRPEEAQIDVFVRGFWNPWGHHFDRWGQSLITDGANGEGVTHGVPGASYPAAVGATRILHGMNPGSPKHCGLEILSGRHLPDDWRGNAITHDFRGHRVCRFVLSDNGSTYFSREGAELIKTNHPAFRPIDVKMGPDGAIYIADWYNPIIQHGEVDFRDPRRDKTHGRIWRVTAKGRPLVPRPDLVGAKTPALLDFLKAPEDWTRQQAKRVLKERGAKDVLPELAKWLKALDPADKDYDHHRLEAAWVYESFGEYEPKLIEALLAAKEPGARAAAVRIVSHFIDTPKLANPLPLLTKAAADDHPRVRMEAVRALAEVKSPRAVEVAMTALDRPLDPVLEYALWLTARELEPHWLPAFREGKLDFGGNARHLGFALEAVGNRSAVQPLLALLRSGKVAPEREEAMWALVARAGGPNELRAVFDYARKPETPSARRAALLGVLEEVAKQRLTKPAGDLAGLNPLMSSEDEAVRIAALRLAGRWNLVGADEPLARLAADAKAKPELRTAAIDGLTALGDSTSRTTLARLAGTGEDDPKVRVAALVGLASLDLPAAAGKAADLLAAAKPGEPVTEVYAAFLARRGGADALAKALRGKKLEPDVAKLGIRAVRASVQDAAGLTDALSKAGGLAAGKKEPTPEEVKLLAAEVLQSGDPVRGEEIFRRKELQCLACHGIGGAGGQVGPDLTSIGASAPVDYLVESILIPNKAVKEGYHAVRVQTVAGQTHAGIKVRQTKAELVLRTPEDKEIVIPANDVDEVKDSRSLMPDGLADTLTRRELTDLVRFLSELGKVGPYAPGKARVVRRWQAVEPTKENMNLFRRTRIAAAAEGGNAFLWSSAYARVSGDLPLAGLPRLVVWQNTAPLAVVRCEVSATAAGPAKLKLNSADGVSLYLGNVPVAAQKEMLVTLRPGVQTLTFVIDLTKRTDDLRCEVDDAPDSPARVTPVGGK